MPCSSLLFRTRPDELTLEGWIVRLTGLQYLLRIFESVEVHLLVRSTGLGEARHILQCSSLVAPSGCT